MNLTKKNIFLYLLILLSLTACGSSKTEVADQRVSLPPPHINCPEDGDCSFEILKNSVLEMKYDSQGKLYPEINEGSKVVIKYHYKKKTEKDVMDNSYSEYVYLEFDPDDKQMILKDKELVKAKMIFGRICYCKGSMGYFPVKEGSLFLFNHDNNLQIRTSFKVHKVPQVIQQIDENIKY